MTVRLRSFLSVIAMTEQPENQRVIPRIVLRVDLGPHQGQRLLELAEEVVDIGPREIVLDVTNVADEHLRRVASFVEDVSTACDVKLCGLRAPQMRRLLQMGIDVDRIIVGNYF
jgi:hypothetical protein